MKILSVNMSLDPVSGGGTAERTFQISRALVREGAECTILTTDVGLNLNRRKALKGIEVVALPCLVKRFYLPAVSFRQLNRLVSECDVIEIMNHWTIINALVYLIAKKLNKPYIVCPAGALPFYGRSRWLKTVYNWVIGKKIIREAEGHVAISIAEIPQFQQYGLSPNAVSLIPNGVDAADFQANDQGKVGRRFVPGESPFILFVGRLNSIKGPDLLLKAFFQIKDAFPDFHLVFAGPDGGMLTELKNLTTQFKIDHRVHFPGYIGGDEKSQIYHAAALVVIPSRQEAMSIVVLEAGITGTPVLISDQCGFDEIGHIRGGHVTPATVDGIQKGLSEILKYPEKLESYGERLKQFTCENYTWDTVIKKYIELYNHILSKEFA